jgi:phosphoglycerate-specific signal transduction histidine kinase
MEANTDDAGDISRSSCEGCQEYKQRHTKLYDKYRKAEDVKQKLRSRVVELEKANKALAGVNSIF